MESDAAARAQYEKKKREDVENDYHNTLVDKDDEITKLKEANEETNKKLNELMKKTQENSRQLSTWHEKWEKQEKELKNANEQLKRHAQAAKLANSTIAEREMQLKEMQKKKADEFQAKKKAQQELAEARATNQGLHEVVDKMEKEKASLLDLNADIKGQLHTIHSTLEQSFRDIDATNISTPEFASKIAELSSGLQRTDSHASMGSEAGEKAETKKKSRKSLSDEIDDLFGPEPADDDDDEGDRTLTEPAELAEMRQQLQQQALELDEAKTREAAHGDKIAELQRRLLRAKVELENEREREENEREERERERERGAPALGFSATTAVATAPVAPVPAPPAPAQVTVVTVWPSPRDAWAAAPWWLVVLCLALVLCGSFAAFSCVAVLRERAIWLGANEMARAAAVRSAVAREAAAWGGEGRWFVGTRLAVGEWLGEPAPKLLT